MTPKVRARRLDRRILLSVVIVVAIFVPLMLLGRVAAFSLDVECDSPVPQGQELDCDLTLTINDGERIPIQNLQIDISGQAPGQPSFEVTFDPFGNIFGVNDADGLFLSLGVPTQNPDLAFGYGYGPRFGYDQRVGYGYDFGYGYGYDFGYGYGYGYGYGFQFVPQQISFLLIVDTTAMVPGDYCAVFKANTGDPDKPTFESDSKCFTVVEAGNAGGSSLSPSDFALHVQGQYFPGGYSGTVLSLTPGSYKVTEDFGARFVITFAGDCSGTAPPTEELPCTVTNTTRVHLWIKFLVL